VLWFGLVLLSLFTIVSTYMYVCICDDLVFLASKYPTGIKKVNCFNWQRNKGELVYFLYAHGHGQQTISLFFSTQYSVPRYSTIPRRNHNAFFVLMQDVTVITNTWHFMSEFSIHSFCSWRLFYSIQNYR